MAPEIWSRIAPQQIAEHEVHFLYEFDGLPLTGPSITFGYLGASKFGWIPDDQLAALRGRYRNEKIWEKAVGGAGTDFYSHLKQIVDGQREDLATFWRLTPHAKSFLTSADLYEKDTPRSERVRKQIVLTLPDSKMQRLAAHGVAARSLAIVLDSGFLHIFATGKSFAHLIVRAEPIDGAGPLTAMELVEAQVALARVNELSWQYIEGTKPLAAFNLNALIRQLVQGEAAAVRKAVRIRTYTYARLGSYLSSKDLDFLGFYLARHFSSDYLTDPAMQGVERVIQFETVRHTIALEGAATLISPDASGKLPAYLEHFTTNTLRAHYVPIALLALHEYGFLIDRTSRSVMNYEDERSVNKTLQALERLRSDSLVFRLCYRFSQVSHITMHNEMNQAFRKALGLDRMMNEFAADVTEIEAFLRAVQEHNTENRFYWFSVIGGASLAGFAALTIFTAIFRVLLSWKSVQDHVLGPFDALLSTEWRDWLSPGHSMDGIAHAPEVFGLILGLMIFMIAFLMISRQRPLPHIRVQGEVTMHAMLEQMTKTLARE
jgi:hypothetical protein